MAKIIVKKPIKSLEVDIDVIKENGRSFNFLNKLPGSNLFGYTVDIEEDGKSNAILIYIPNWTVDQLFNGLN